MTDVGGGTIGASSLSFFGNDSTVSLLHGALDDDGSAYRLGDWERTTITGSATTTGGGVCSLGG